MGVITIMLVFGPHCPEICDHFRQPVEYPGAVWLHVYVIPVIFNHYSLAGFPAYLTSSSRHQRVIVIMNSKIIDLIHVGSCFVSRGTADTIAWRNDSLNLFDWKIRGLLLCSNVRCLGCPRLRCSFILSCIRLAFWSIENRWSGSFNITQKSSQYIGLRNLWTDYPENLSICRNMKNDINLKISLYICRLLKSCTILSSIIQNGK